MLSKKTKLPKINLTPNEKQASEKLSKRTYIVITKGIVKWRAIRASVGDVGGVLAWVAWLACLCRCRVNVGYVVGVLTCVTWWCTSVGKMVGVLVWVAWVAY